MCEIGLISEFLSLLRSGILEQVNGEVGEAGAGMVLGSPRGVS